MTTYDINDNIERDLYYLENLDDFKVHEDDPDVRGWNVYDSTGNEIGEVENLIVDRTARKVRYLVIEIEDDLNRHRNLNFFESVGEDVKDFFGDDNDRHIIVPIGTVTLDEDNKRVISGSLTARHFANSPRYRFNTKTFISPNFELATARYYTHENDTYNNYRNYYRDKKYRSSVDTKQYTIKDRSFYDTDLFSRNSYFNRTRNANSTTMASVDTGARKF